MPAPGLCSARFRGQQRRRDELSETAQAEGNTSLLREEGEGETRRELQAAGLGYNTAVFLLLL